jgi:hypothetical protein
MQAGDVAEPTVGDRDVPAGFRGDPSCRRRG